MQEFFLYLMGDGSHFQRAEGCFCCGCLVTHYIQEFREQEVPLWGALPQKDVALVLGLSHVYYRVLCNRVKSFAMRVKGRILAGERLLLNMNALDMRDRLDADFSGWYDLLSFYYAETIAHFAQAEEINTLRYSYATDSSDMFLHDVDCIFQYGGLTLPEIEEGN